MAPTPRGEPRGVAPDTKYIRRVPEWVVAAAGLDTVPVGVDDEELRGKSEPPRCYARTVQLLQWALGCSEAIARKKMAACTTQHLDTKLRWIDTHHPVRSVNVTNIPALLKAVGCDKEQQQTVARALACVSTQAAAVLNAAAIVAGDPLVTKEHATAKAVSRTDLEMYMRTSAAEAVHMLDNNTVPATRGTQREAAAVSRHPALLQPASAGRARAPLLSC